jgi:hypothetical protein
MTNKFRRVLPVVAAAINENDGGGGQLFITDIIQTHQINAVHFAHGRFGADAKRAYAAVFAKVVLVFLGVEEVLGEFTLARQQSKVFWHRDRRPKAGAAAYRAIAAVGVLREVKISLKLHCAAVATAVVGFFHISGF